MIELSKKEIELFIEKELNKIGLHPYVSGCGLHILSRSEFTAGDHDNIYRLLFNLLETVRRKSDGK